MSRLLCLTLLACKPAPSSAAPVPEAHRDAASPVACPDGTRLRGQAPPDGNRVWCETGAGVSHGPFAAWHQNGRDKTRGAFRDGSAQGEWTSWYDDGQLRSKGSYESGERVGEWKSFAPDGTPQPLEPRAETSTEIEPSLPNWDLQVGIPACDEYISSYMRCIESKAPDATRAQMQEAIEKTVDAWKQVATGPGRDALEDTCRQALEAVKQSSAAWGCEF